MENYYANSDEYGNCTEECKLINDGVKIGSIACTECEYCTKYNKDEYGTVIWITCRELNKALGLK